MNIDEKTSIPLFAVMICMPTLFFCIFWLAKLDARVETVEKDSVLVQETHEDVITIMAKLGIERKIKRRH